MNPIAELRERHTCPNALREILEVMTDAARGEIPGLQALVLSGSVATVDFVWRKSGEYADHAHPGDEDNIAASPLIGERRRSVNTRLRELLRESRSQGVGLEISG